jgi:phosphohistidine phosphatase
MRLFFLRHGIAEPGHSGLRDFDRQLTAEGRAELEDVARGMRRLKVRPDPLLSSPLVRARQTAEAVAPLLGATVEIADELRSGASFEAFQQLARRYGAAESLMFVGHEPDFSETAAALIGADGEGLVLKKAGLIRVDLDGRFERGQGRLRWLLTPHQLALIGGMQAEHGGDAAGETANERTDR